MTAVWGSITREVGVSRPPPDGLVLVAVDGGRSGQLDHRLGSGVVAVGRGEVDHLVIRRQVAEELEAARGMGVVERDEGVVEDERRPAAAGGIADEPSRAAR